MSGDKALIRDAGGHYHIPEMEFETEEEAESHAKENGCVLVLYPLDADKI